MLEDIKLMDTNMCAINAYYIFNRKSNILYTQIFEFRPITSESVHCWN